MTVAAGLITAYLFNITWWKSILAWFVVGELLHVLFGANTAFVKLLGLDHQCLA